jgi:hypothetical protein
VTTSTPDLSAFEDSDLDDAGEVLSLVLLALFIAIGLDPAVVWLERRGLRSVLGTQRLTVKVRTLRATLDLQRRSHLILRHCAGEIVGR